MLYASGIGPIHGKIATALCRRTLRQVNVITVRDPLSYAFLQKTVDRRRLFLSADPVCVHPLESAPCQKYILAFVRERQITSMLDFLAAKSLPIVLAVMDPTSDMTATKKLAHLLKKQNKKVLLVTDSSLQKILSLIKHATMVVSARLHALILAFDMGVPMLGISDDNKISSFVHMAYEGISLPSDRQTISKHFRQKQRHLRPLAKRDAEIALCLSCCATSERKTIDKPRKK